MSQTENDSLAIQNEKTDSLFKNPKKAALLSTFLPGAGQAYNHKSEKKKRAIWKIPIIYAGLGTCTYFYFNNVKNYKSFRTEYVNRLNDPSAISLDYERYSTDALRTGIDQYKNWRDLSVVAFVGVYVLQILDASVDAHLFNHDVSPNLSLNIQPQFGYDVAAYTGVKFTLTPKHRRK